MLHTNKKVQILVNGMSCLKDYKSTLNLAHFLAVSVPVNFLGF